MLLINENLNEYAQQMSIFSETVSLSLNKQTNKKKSRQTKQNRVFYFHTLLQCRIITFSLQAHVHRSKGVSLGLHLILHYMS